MYITQQITNLNLFKLLFQWLIEWVITTHQMEWKIFSLLILLMIRSSAVLHFVVSVCYIIHFQFNWLAWLFKFVVWKTLCHFHKRLVILIVCSHYSFITSNTTNTLKPTEQLTQFRTLFLLIWFWFSVFFNITSHPQSHYNAKS